MRAILLILVVTAFLTGLALSAFAARVEIADDRMALVNGQRTFVLGLYENPKDDAVLAEVAKAGFNLVYVSGAPDIAALDRLQAQKLFGWINTGANIDLSADRETREAGLKEMADKFAKHPALMVWEVPDEALWNNWHLAREWRWAEPGELAKRIDVLQDKALADRLRADITQAGEMKRAGRIAESESLMDGVWVALGEKTPHPDWSVSTAQARSEVMAQGMVDGYQVLKGLDRDHPVWMNHAPRNSIDQLAMFNAGADVAGCDIYPVPQCVYVSHSDLMEQTATAVGAYTTRMQDAAPGKPVWMVLQGFGWADIREKITPEMKAELRRPTKAETRFMAYDAIVRGGRGILYWGTAYIEKDSDCWKELLAVVAELSSLQTVLSAPDSSIQPSVGLAPTLGSMDRGVMVLAKGEGTRPALLVVNEWADAVTYTLSGLQAPDGTVYKDAVSGVEAAVKEGELSLPIAALSVHMLQAP